MNTRSTAARRRGAPATALALVAFVLVAGAVNAGAQWSWGETEPAPNPVYPDVTVDAAWLADHLADRGTVVVDARDPDAYAAGHIPGAVSLPILSLPGLHGADEVLGMRGLSGRRRIVCCGGGPDTVPADAALLFWFLEAAGADVALLEGGIDAWIDTGHDLSTGLVEPPTATWGLSARPEFVATQEYVRLHFGEKGFEIIDARGWDAWESMIDEAEWRDPPRTGHVPHSLPFDFAEFEGTDGSLREPESTREIFSALGPRPTSPIGLQDEFIVYGDGTSGNGAVGYFLLRRAGLAKVRLFRGGWRQWLADTSLPAVRIISAEEIEARLSGPRRWFRPDARPSEFAIFDVRHDSDWSRGHVPGSVSLTSRLFADSLDVYLERQWPGIDRASTPIVTYCYGSNCIRSRLTSSVAARKGFLRIERFYGGMEDWRGIGGRIVR